MIKSSELWGSFAGDGAVALGFFDGVHLGHRAVISQMAQVAAARGLVPRVFTYDTQGPAPDNKAGQTLLQSDAQKEAVLAALGVAQMICPPFDQMRDLTPEEFIRRVLLETLGARVIVCGFNYRFGKRAAGDVALLRQVCTPLGVEVQALDPVLWQGEPVSSTRIRQAVREGRMEDAAAMLGTPFAILRPVQQGRRLGRLLGTPTINQTFLPRFTVPRLGVYHSRVRVGERLYHGVTGVGVKPTVGDPDLTCETYILDFSGDLYGQLVEVQLLRFLRDEEKFASVEALAEQIHRDIKVVRELTRE